jgi:transaldolase
MKLFLDTANTKEIREAMAWGVIDGITTNPTLVAREGRDFRSLLAEICQLVPGPVSAEVISTEAAEMIAEARELAAIAPQVVIKVPVTPDGLKAVAELKKSGIKTNVTLVFSFNQALLAAKAGAAYISPFLGRLDDLGHDGVALVGQICTILRSYNLQSEVIAASIRHPLHVVQVAAVGADVATVPFSVLKSMFKHPLTDLGIERFLADWQAVEKP